MQLKNEEDKLSVIRINVISKFQVEYGYEDFTLMSPLQHLISQNYNLNDKVEIAGFSKLHPTDETIILRVQFINQNNQTAEKVLETTIKGCELLMDLTSDILNKISKI